MNKLIHNQINIDFVEHRSEQKKNKKPLHRSLQSSFMQD